MRSVNTLIRTLQLLGTKYLFSLSGNQIMSIYDAWVDSDIEILHVRHEAAAVHMADAWGRLTGTPGVALLTAGPGHANAISAMYVALMAESPVVVLSGHAPLKALGHSPLQEGLYPGELLWKVYLLPLHLHSHNVGFDIGIGIYPYLDVLDPQVPADLIYT